MVIPGRPTKRLGELLVQRHLITPEQLEQVLLEQRSTGQFLGTMLLRLGLITPEALLVTLAQQFGIPCEPLPLDRVDWAIAKQFPVSALSSGTCFPIRTDGTSVTVAIANPLEIWGLGVFEKASGFRTVRPVLVLEQELRSVVQAYRQHALQTIEQRLRNHGRGETH